MDRVKKISNLLKFGIAGFLISAPLYAATPLWTYSAPTPAQVTISKNDTATIQYTITNQSRKSKNLVLKSTDGLSASSCYLAGRGSVCTLTLTVNGSALPGGKLQQGPVLCEQGNLNQCYQPTLNNQLNITVENSPFLPSIVYIGNGGSNEILKCESVSNGNLVNCTPAASQIVTPTSLVINPAKTVMYAFSQDLSDELYYLCDILTDGNLNCVEQQLLGIGKLFAMAINANLNLGYVMTGDDGVGVCAIDAQGVLNSCVKTLTSEGGLLSAQLNKEATWLYMTQVDDSQILKCAVNPDGSLGVCNRTGPSLEFKFITLNPSGTLAYLTVPVSSQVLRCDILANGDVDNCNNTGTGFNGPFRMAFNASGNVAYITNALGNTVSQCAVDGQGALNACSPTANNLAFPAGIAVL